jgi:hypothetical protein
MNVFSLLVGGLMLLPFVMNGLGLLLHAGEGRGVAVAALLVALLLAVSAFVAVRMAVSHVIGRRFERDGVYSMCRYDLSGIRVHRCPECGAPSRRGGA